MGQLLRRLIIVTALALAAVSCLIVTPAAAFDGRVPDGRATTPDDEIRAYYWHGLDRDPDAGGFNNYMWFVNKDCRWGILDAGIKILDSAEAQHRWPSTEQKVGALYASLLNRGPDPGGFATYMNAINQRGLRWSITSMQASDEFHSRLDRICAGRTSSNATVWNPHDATAHAIRINNGAETLVVACGVGLLINTFGKLTLLKGAARAIKRSATAAGKVAKTAGGACYGAYQMLLAADRTASLAEYESANSSPVFLEQNTRTYWNLLGRWCETWIRVGLNAMTWNGYKANYRC
jgi:hypothetical protein